MAVVVTHQFVSPVADEHKPDEVGPDEWNDEHKVEGLGSAAEADVGDFATAAQGALADTAVQPGDLAAVATSGAAADVSFVPFGGVSAVNVQSAIEEVDGDIQTIWTVKAELSGADFTGAVTVPMLGINTTPDATNPLNATINKALFSAKTTANGGDDDIRLTLSKTAATDLASFLFQTNYSARAEFGLIGNDDFTIKVSPDGSTWFDGIVIDKDDGRVAFPNTPVIMGSTGSTDNRLLRADGTGTKTAQASAVTVDDGGNITSFGGQIAFPATQNPSSDPNTIDDCEKGSWTPGISFGGGTTGITYTTQVGRYTKIANLVAVGCQVALSNKGSSTGNARITGLPFTTLNVSEFRSALNPGFFASLSGLTAGIALGIDNNQTTVNVLVPGTASTAAATNANFTNTSQIQASGPYLAN